MGDKIQIFDNPEFGEIRVIMKDGEPHFVAADVCRILDLGNPSQALTRLDDDEKGITTIDTPGGEQSMLIVTEPGLYHLIFTSRKPEAHMFRRWVYHEVLLSIRKTGSYSIAPDKTTSESAFEREKLAVERERISFERDKLAAEREKFAIGRELIAVERDKLAFERDKFAVENDEDAKIFEAVQTLRELASAAGDEKYMRSKLVRLAANLLVDKNFIEGHEIIFKKCQ